VICEAVSIVATYFMHERIAAGWRHGGGRCVFVGRTNLLRRFVKRSCAIPFPRECSSILCWCVNCKLLPL